MEREREHALATLKSTANASFAGQAVPTTLASIDNIISRMQGLKRKLEGLHEEGTTIQQHTKKRIQHLQDLFDVPSLVDAKYDKWSRIRVDRLLVDYLLRSGYGESAKELARAKDIEELVDIEVFMNCNRIRESLIQRRTAECLAWCAENKQGLKKLNVRAVTI